MLIYPELWQKVQDFEMSSPLDEFGFSTRLQFENNWTIAFSLQAIEEYKKFMFLAAVNDKMVSPSEIVDIVWHQHLIYSESYKNFCGILGKNILHVPSTHNMSEKQKFSDAMNFTEQEYQRHFGELPTEFWKSKTMYSGLGLTVGNLIPDSKFVLFWAIFTVILFFLIKPILLRIDNPFFLLGYVPLSFLLVFLMKDFTQLRLNKLVAKLNENFVFSNLTLPELIYLQGGQRNLILSYYNNLVKNNKIHVDKNDVDVLTDKPSDDVYENIILSQIKSKNNNLVQLYEILRKKTTFLNVGNVMNKLTEYVFFTNEYQKIFLPLKILTYFLLSIGICRLILGISRGRPIILLIIALVVLSFYFANVLKKQKQKGLAEAVLAFNKKKFMYRETELSKENHFADYFVYGTLATGLVAFSLYSFMNGSEGALATSGSSCGSSGSSCGNSCGSSCGSSCGGCGGGGD